MDLPHRHRYSHHNNNLPLVSRKNRHLQVQSPFLDLLVRPPDVLAAVAYLYQREHMDRHLCFHQEYMCLFVQELDSFAACHEGEEAHRPTQDNTDVNTSVLT
jgi:hypothetical protein